MKKANKTQLNPSPTLFEFEIDPEALSGEVTSHAGLPTLAETFRALGGKKPASCHLNGKRRERGYSDLCLSAKIATHARQTFLKLAAAVESVAERIVPRGRLPLLLPSG